MAAAYRRKLKKELIERCENLEVKCPQNMKKEDIIKLILNAENQKSTGYAVSKKKQPAKKPSITEEEEAPVVKKSVKRPIKKVAKKVPKPEKDSIGPKISIVQTYLSMGRKGTNVSGTLRAFLRLYDWTGYEKLMTEVEDAILKAPKRPKAKPAKSKKGSIPLESPSPSPVKPPPKKKAVGPKYVPGEYETMDILSVKFGKKGEAVPKTVKKQERIAITLTELRKEVDNPVFIKAFTKSSKDLMKAKVIFYTRRMEDAKREHQALREKIKKLEMAGVRERTIEDMYPGYPTMGAFIIDLESLIGIVKKRGEQSTEEEIKEGLIEAIDDSDEGISSLIGREDVKNQIASQLYSFSKGYKTFIGSFNNIAIYGSAGVGKTRLAQVIAFAFSRVGILATDRVKIATRAELVGQYIGQTAPRTRSVLLETLEGVLFIDEAYQLTQCPEDKVGSKDFGSEAVTELVNFLDKYIGMSIVIVAGYEGVMNRCFMTFNEGLPRRFPYRYILSPYSDRELTDILVSNLKRKVPDDVTIDAKTSNFLFSMITKLRLEVPDALKNQAGDMLNLSAALNKAITSSFRIKWKNGDLGHNIPILLSGFDDFLNTKGFSVYG